MANHMAWRIVLRNPKTVDGGDIPQSILTRAPKFRHDSMPDELGILLPNCDGPRGLVNVIARTPALALGHIVGLFLADPFLNVGVDSVRLSEARIAWVTNLPSVAQQDREFSRQLTDVALDQALEFDHLDQFRAQGFKTAAVVADDRGAQLAVETEPDVLIVLPRVVDYAAGFPSFRQRGAAVTGVRDAARDADWRGPILGLADASEAEHQALWPDSLDGVVCRPTLI